MAQRNSIEIKRLDIIRTVTVADGRPTIVNFEIVTDVRQALKGPTRPRLAHTDTPYTSVYVSSIGGIVGESIQHVGKYDSNEYVAKPVRRFEIANHQIGPMIPGRALLLAVEPVFRPNGGRDWPQIGVTIRTVVLEKVLPPELIPDLQTRRARINNPIY